jgi:hypothetical protein
MTSMWTVGALCPFEDYNEVLERRAFGRFF